MFQYTHGASDPSRISPDAWTHDQWGMDRPGNADIQLQLQYDYRNNPPHYARWQQYFRAAQPPTLIVWGKNDPFFTLDAVHAYERDLANHETHLLDGGHCALEEHTEEIASLIRGFLARTAEDTS